LTVKLTKLQFRKLLGWQKTEELRLNDFELSRVRDFLGILSALDVADASKSRISLGSITLEGLSTILRSSLKAGLLEEVSKNPDFTADIFAIAAKRRVVQEFEKNLESCLDEAAWQRFFEENPWIFGLGVHHIFLDRVGDKWEQKTTGDDFARSGKRADALARTRAEVSQTVIIEIKKSDTLLLQKKEYRSGCWGVSAELSDAVTQVQKTVFEFERNRFRISLKDAQGNETGEKFFSTRPRSYLVVGRLSEIDKNEDKIACFELYRRELKAPDIITFDELLQRAKVIVDNLGSGSSKG
jgi:hypothetical protein